MGMPCRYRNVTRLCRMFDQSLVLIMLLCLLPDHGETTVLEVPEQDVPRAEEQAVEFSPRMGTFYYVIEWGGSKAADARVSVKREGDFYRMIADQETTPFIDRIYRIRYSGETLIEAEDLLPKKTLIKGEFGRRTRVDEIHYGEDGGVEAVVTKSKPRSSPKREVYEIDAETFAIDVFAAVFLARSFDWQEGESQHIEIFNEDKHHLITLDCLGQSIFEEGDIRTTAWVIRPGAHNLDNPKAETTYSKTRIYLSADESRDLLKIKTKLGFGTIKMTLVEYHLR